MEPSHGWRMLSQGAITVGMLPTEADVSWAAAEWTVLNDGKLAVVSPVDGSLVRLDSMGRESVLIAHPPWQHEGNDRSIYIPRIRARFRRIIYKNVSRIGWVSIDGSEEGIIERLDEGEYGTYVEAFDVGDEGVAYLRCRRSTKPASCDLVVADWDGEEVWSKTLSMEKPAQLACDWARRVCFVQGETSRLCVVALDGEVGNAEKCRALPWSAGVWIQGLLPVSGMLVLGRGRGFGPEPSVEEGILGSWMWGDDDGGYVAEKAPIAGIQVSGSFVYFLEYQQGIPRRILRAKAELVQQCLGRRDP